jgi:hypothetical protein
VRVKAGRSSITKHTRGAPKTQISSAEADLERIVSKLPIGRDSRIKNNDQLLELISDRVDRYRRFEKHLTAGVKEKQVSEKLERLRSTLASLIEELKTSDNKTRMLLIDAAGNFFDAQRESSINETPVLPTRRRGLQRFANLLVALEMFESWVNNASESSPPPPRGRRPRDNLIWLVTQLGYLFMTYTGRPFTRTRKGNPRARDFVAVVLRAKLPEQSFNASSIDYLMRLAIGKIRTQRRTPAFR